MVGERESTGETFRGGGRANVWLVLGGNSLSKKNAVDHCVTP